MKILHCCLAAFYIDNYSYQENILPKMHRLQGHDVAILASTETYIDNATLGYVQPGSYHTKEGIPITRVSYRKWLPHFIAKKLRFYEAISTIICSFDPDIIFLHDCQFISIAEVASYANKNRHVRIYVDGHTDYINSARGWISKNILHGIIYKWCANKIEPFTKKFYGTLPLRVDFFINVYKIPKEKTELLVMGADHTVLDLSKKNDIRKSIRAELEINDSDLVIVTGGKIEIGKNIHILMKAVNDLEKTNLKLIVFGSPNTEMKDEINKLAQGKNIRFIGWIPSEKAYEYFLASDLAFFPGTHSVLWEQAVGVGLPCVFKKWIGMQHIDLNGNCIFINSADLMEVKECILTVYNNNSILEKMKKVAQERGITEFSYYEIAKRAIEE